MGCGLYIHIPYCQSRCHYCDFHSQGGASAVPEEYVAALVRCLNEYAPPRRRPASVYFGGGTPSLLAPAQAARLLEAANPAPGAEITLEANPESATPASLAGWRAAGVNRLSLGVQTAGAHSLKRLGRPHTAEDAAAALANAHRAGFGNISADMMLRLPGYTTEELAATLALLCGGGVSHISAYMLKIELHTLFGRKPPKDLPGEDETAGFYLAAAEALEQHGFAQYEISNFARPGFESRHNLLYWNLDEWLGIGAAAHSHLGGRRFSFAPDTAAFIEGSAPPLEQGQSEANDYIMLRLRLCAGLDKAALAARFGARLGDGQTAFLQTLARQGLARQTEGGFALTRKGMLVQNAILGKLLE